MSLFIRGIRLPNAGEAVQVNFPERNWGWLPALVDSRVEGEKAGDEILINVVVFNRHIFPNKVQFRQRVAHHIAHDGVRPVWRHIPPV